MPKFRLIIYYDLFKTLCNFSSVINRRCTKATTVKGIQIPEETIVAIDVMSLNFNQEYWGDVDVNEFYPLRLVLFN